jgi:hypothetical protein
LEYINSIFLLMPLCEIPASIGVVLYGLFLDLYQLSIAVAQESKTLLNCLCTNHFASWKRFYTLDHWIRLHLVSSLNDHNL